MTRTAAFRTLHERGTFVMPNPWDRGSARILQELGFAALATTSAGLGRALGKDDQQVTRDELVAHVADLTAMLDVPLNVDSERLFPEEPGGIAATVRLLADAGAAGCSIEDYRPATGAVIPLDEAADAVAEAAAACAAHDVVLTARAENALYGGGDLDDTIARLTAYRAAGADVLYAPGLTAAGDLARVVAEAGGPVNVLALPGTPPIDRLAELGVRRVSTGSALFNVAYGTLREHAARLVPTRRDR
jgi:2-methylisocitrate lyase-like PEP mutase family enzyme